MRCLLLVITWCVASCVLPYPVCTARTAAVVVFGCSCCGCLPFDVQDTGRKIDRNTDNLADKASNKFDEVKGDVKDAARDAKRGVKKEANKL